MRENNGWIDTLQIGRIRLRGWDRVDRYPDTEGSAQLGKYTDTTGRVLFCKMTFCFHVRSIEGETVANKYIPLGLKCRRQTLREDNSEASKYSLNNTIWVTFVLTKLMICLGYKTKVVADI